MFDLFTGEDAFEITASYMTMKRVPEGVYILETPDCYIAVFNPDENTVNPKIIECEDIEDASEVLDEKWNAFKRQNLDDWEVKRLWD